MARVQVENNLVVGIEVGHTSDKKEEIDHRVVDTWNNPEVGIVDPIDSWLEEQLDLCSIVAGKGSEENSDTNCYDFYQMDERAMRLLLRSTITTRSSSLSLRRDGWRRLGRRSRVTD